jgi:hypothetical protein
MLNIGNFIALTLYGSSALALDGGALRSRVSEWSRNTAMCALTEQVIFTDPYTTHSNNRWTTPQLDLYAGIYMIFVFIYFIVGLSYMCLILLPCTNPITMYTYVYTYIYMHIYIYTYTPPTLITVGQPLN